MKACLQNLLYLLDVHFFTPDDIALNKKVMLWSDDIRPIFEESEEVSIIINWLC